MTEPDKSSEGFLERWSRKKIDAEREAPAPVPTEPSGEEAAPPDDRAPPSRQEQDAKTSAPAIPQPEFDLASLPSLESITAATDIRAFLAPGVPKEIARAALRRAWSTDPAIRDFIGLAENAWDFTDPTAMPGFGALPPGYDIKKVVAQIFGESESPADHAAAADGPDDPQVVNMAEEVAPPEQAAEAAPSTAGVEETVPPGISPSNRQFAHSDFVQRDNNIATHNSISGDETEEHKNRRQHGGALPQ